MISEMLICLIVSQNIVVSDTGYKERECVYTCQKNQKEIAYTESQYQCPKKLYIDDKK